MQFDNLRIGDDLTMYGNLICRIACVLVSSFAFVTLEASAQGSRSQPTLFQPWLNTPANGPPTFGSLGSPRRARKSHEATYPLSPVNPNEYRGDLDKGAALGPKLRRQQVEYSTNEAPGTIIVDTTNTYLYLVLGNGQAMRYGIGVGREGFTWSGRERVSRMAEWPDWRPPAEMLARDPDLPEFVPGGLGNPLGARALYLGETLYRIHGTNDPASIGTYRSSGCIRLLNVDVVDLYQRVAVGTPVIVLANNPNGSGQSR